MRPDATFVRGLSVKASVGFIEQVNGLFDRSSSTGQPSLIHWKLRSAGIYRLSESGDRKVGKFLGDCLESGSDLVKFSWHVNTIYRDGEGTVAAVSSLPDLHEWVSFSDSDGDTWLFDVTFMVSNYMCIYGRGCPGVFTELAPEYEHGCCTYGAHFVDDEDRGLVIQRAEQMSAEEWQLKDRAAEMGGPIYQNDEGEWITETIDDACIFLNRPGHSAGAGCALHQAALSRGERPIDWKPDVCWQVPIRFDDSTDDSGHTTYIVREWKRRDWGEGGVEFAWWCTDNQLAFVGDRPVWRSLRDELLELVGEEPYGMLVDYLSDGPAGEFLPHPRVRKHNSEV